MFPNMLFMKLQYKENNAYVYSMSSGGSYLAERGYRQNSLFDPEYTGTGHQPYGFDDIATWYNFYTVVGCKATFYGRLVHGTGPGVRVQMYANVYTTTSDFENTWEDPRGNLVARKTLTKFSTYDDTKFKLTKYFRTKDIRPVLMQGQGETPVSQNPVYTNYIWIHMKSADSQDATVNGSVILKYYCIFTNRLSVPQS